jgi:hypothetical protein
MLPFHLSDEPVLRLGRISRHTSVLSRRSPRVRVPRLEASSVFEPTQSAESEVEGFGTGVEKLYLKLAIGDLSCLPDELVKLLLDNGTVALIIDVCAVCHSWRMSIEEHSKSNRLLLNHRTHD